MKIELGMNARVVMKSMAAAKEGKIKKIKKKGRKNWKKSDLIKKIKSNMHEILYKIAGMLE